MGRSQEWSSLNCGVVNWGQTYSMTTMWQMKKYIRILTVKWPEKCNFIFLGPSQSWSQRHSFWRHAPQKVSQIVCWILWFSMHNFLFSTFKNTWTWTGPHTWCSLPFSCAVLQHPAQYRMKNRVARWEQRKHNLLKFYFGILISTESNNKSILFSTYLFFVFHSELWLMWSSRGQGHSANGDDVGKLDHRCSSTKGHPTRKQTHFFEAVCK